MFVPSYDLSNLVPATYNPREISQESLTILEKSIEEIGMIKPIIATSSGTIIAGHQRTRTMKKLGYNECPAYVIDGIGEVDEIRFNQLHNASDKEIMDGLISIHPIALQEKKYGWNTIEPQFIKVSGKLRGAAHRNEILRLLTRYGEWGASVINKSGSVLISKNYAVCCKLLDIPLRVYMVPNEMTEQVKYYFSQEYGKFSYKHLPKTTYVQSMAQLMRLRDGDKLNESTLYETFVLPYLTKEMRILDFGAGQKDYVHRLKAKGFNIHGMELFYRKKGELSIDLPQVQKDIDILIDELKTNGRFDVVVCDSVLNSVDSLQAQADVLLCLNAFCKARGKIFFSGRTMDAMLSNQEDCFKHVNYSKKPVYFTDDDGFSAMYQRGFWLYQKFHKVEEVRNMTEKYVSDEFEVYNTKGTIAKEKFNSATWSVVATKKLDLMPLVMLDSLKREFNMALPDNQSLGRGDEVVSAFLKAGN